MFDRTIVQQGDTHNYTTVTEKRAPTDESVRLLREMEAEAKKQVIKAVSLPSNELKGVVHMMRDTLSCRTRVAVLFKLNGKDHQVLVSLDDFQDNSIDSRIKKIVRGTADYLAGAILQGVFGEKQIRDLVAHGIKGDA